jgi:protein-tyrosine-phosphatase
MAEVLFADLVKQNGQKDDDWRIASAGVWAYDGMPATSNTIAAMQARGLDLKWHRSQGITESLLNDFNLVLCMTYEHKNSLRRNFPGHASKIYLLSEMVEDQGEIDDPVGLSIQTYRSTVDEILNFLQSGFERICQLSS